MVQSRSGEYLFRLLKQIQALDLSADLSNILEFLQSSMGRETEREREREREKEKGASDKVGWIACFLNPWMQQHVLHRIWDNTRFVPFEWSN